jgi:hypothetical protein
MLTKCAIRIHLPFALLRRLTVSPPATDRRHYPIEENLVVLLQEPSFSLAGRARGLVFLLDPSDPSSSLPLIITTRLLWSSLLCHGRSTPQVTAIIPSLITRQLRRFQSSRAVRPRLASRQPRNPDLLCSPTQIHLAHSNLISTAAHSSNLCSDHGP